MFYLLVGPYVSIMKHTCQDYGSPIYKNTQVSKPMGFN